MSTNNLHPVMYDGFLDVTSFSQFDEQGQYKTWLFAGNQSSDLMNLMTSSRNTHDLYNNLYPLLDTSYIGHRSMKFNRIVDQKHTIELTELNIENPQANSGLIRFMLDPVLDQVKDNEHSLEFKLNPEVISQLKEKKLLEPLYRFIMSRGLNMCQEKQEITHTKEHKFKLAKLKAKYLKPKIHPEYSTVKLQLR